MLGCAYKAKYLVNETDKLEIESDLPASLAHAPLRDAGRPARRLNLTAAGKLNPGLPHPTTTTSAIESPLTNIVNACEKKY